MNNHRRIKKLLVDFALGQLPQQAEVEVTTHLTECSRCASELKQIETLLECTRRMRKLSVGTPVCESAEQAILKTVESNKIQQCLEAF
jgi:anti-sigma factor RsiW